MLITLALAVFVPNEGNSNHMTFVPGLCLLLFGLAGGGWGSGLLSLPFLVLLGEASYSFYLMQIPLSDTLVWAANGFRRADVFTNHSNLPLGDSPWNFPVVFAVAIPLSILIFRKLETPLAHPDALGATETGGCR